MTLYAIRRQVPVKGMNTVAPERAMEESFAPVIENAWYYDGITLRRRLCKSIDSEFSAANGTPKEMFEMPVAGGSNGFFVQSSTGGIYQRAGTLFNAPLITGFTGELGHTTLKDSSIVGDGVSAALIWNGTNFVNLPASDIPQPAGDATVGNIFITHQSRCFAAGNANFPLTVFVSAPRVGSGEGLYYWNQETTSPGGVIGDILDVAFDLSEPDVITGLTIHRGFLVVFCRNHILFYNVTPSQNGGISADLYKKIKGEGCVSHKTIQPVGEETIFLSPNGFKKLSLSLIQGDSQVNDISMPINNAIKDLLNGGTVNTADIRSTYNPKYGIYLCTLGNVTYGYQVQFDGWFRWTGIGTNVFTDSLLNTYCVSTTTYGGSYAIYTLTNTVFQDQDWYTVTTPVNMRWVPVPFRSPNIEHKPRWRKIETVFESNSATNNTTITYFRDLDRNVLNTQTVAMAANRQLESGLFEGRHELPIVGRSELCSVDIQNNENTDFRIKLIEMYYNDGGLR